MKIVILGPAYPYRGGIAAYNERLAKQLISEGHDVSIITYTLQYPSFLFPGKTQYSTDPAPFNLQIERSVNAVNPMNWYLVGNKIKKLKPDLIITRFWLPFMGPSYGSILRIIKRNKHTKIITIVDNMIPHESRIGDSIFTKYYIKPVDGFLAMTQSVMDDIESFDRLKPRALSPHPLYDTFGPITSQKEARAELGLSNNYRYILFFGLIRDYKGLDLLLNAFADKRIQKENIKLIIAGEYYDDKDKYQTIINDHNIRDHIIELDKFIPDAEVGLYFNACDVVVQPYKTATQSGVTQIAYHFNKPMIVTNVGGLAEMCPHEKVAYVVEPQIKDISDAILRFFNETDVNKMIENIKEEKKRYNWDILTKAIFDIYNKIK